MLVGKCSECGYAKCIAALDFHHTDSTTKDSTVKDMMGSASWDRIKKELKKCVILCSNCHREHHWEEKHG